MTVNALSLSKDEIKELVSKNWITHDAMWFYHCLQEFGIEKTNQLNKAAIRDMSAIEIRRIHKAMGAAPINTFDEFKHFFDVAMEIATGKFMKYKYTSPFHNLVHAEWDSCFAYEGMKALGVADRYECGVMLRINTWLDTLGIKYEVTPRVTGCMMHTDGKCFRDYQYFFEK
ncbi:MAG: hypothetical protein CVU71_09935 [Deltaproteobacteria bacterium HGW-Deltaproteobacteria-6]|jgi:hypothetical protein|nr:MAG: hypothetical protein CVU71_09935 [Deltaproteobacteria bacterium HGW-Deltaproteobacteria-6]